MFFNFLFYFVKFLSSMSCFLFPFYAKLWLLLITSAVFTLTARVEKNKGLSFGYSLCDLLNCSSVYISFEHLVFYCVFIFWKCNLNTPQGCLQLLACGSFAWNPVVTTDWKRNEVCALIDDSICAQLWQGNNKPMLSIWLQTLIKTLKTVFLLHY